MSKPFDERTFRMQTADGKWIHKAKDWSGAYETTKEKAASVTFHPTRHSAGDDVTYPAFDTKNILPEANIYGRAITNKPGIYPYGSATGTTPVTSTSLKAGSYKSAKIKGKGVTKRKQNALWGRYVPCEYIETSGNKWVDTDIIADNNTEVELDYAIYSSSSVYIFGTRVGGTQYFTISGSQTGGTNTNFVNGSSANVNVGNRVSGVWNRLFQKVATNNGTVTWNATNKNTQSSNSGTYSATIPELTTTIKLFSNSTEFESNGRIYSCKLKQNGTLVRDFVPVKDVVDNVYGMFDRVTETFYGNSGTGSFAGGGLLVPITGTSETPAPTENDILVSWEG